MFEIGKIPPATGSNGKQNIQFQKNPLIGKNLEASKVNPVPCDV